MIADLRPYPEYKESGQGWLSSVPKHWSVLPNRAVFGEVKDRNHPDEEMLSVTITKGIVRQKALLASGSKKDSSNQDRAAYKLVCPNDLAYNKMRAWQGAIGISDFRGIISPAYVVMRLREDYNPRYFHHLYRTPHFAKEAERWSYGITSDMWSLRPEHFKMIYTPLPTAEEQAAIVKFLDHANRRLERTIRAKRKVIALLNEQKQAIIHRAVTRGLDPTVPLKPSGISWLGDIPVHWEVRRLKSLVRFVTSGSRGWARYYSDDGPVFLRIGNISTTSIELKLDRITHVSPPLDAEGERTRVQEDDILLSITAQIGAVGIVPSGLGEAYVNQHTALIRPRPAECNPRWIAYCLLSEFGKRQCQLLTNGGTKVGLTLEDVRTLRVLMPPGKEQESIILQIKTRTRDLDVAITRTEREIALLRKYRTRLTADVVTGKLDVREAASHLPDEGEETKAMPEIDSDEAEEMEPLTAEET
jgi:type I restriction enzyme S subunit